MMELPNVEQSYGVELVRKSIHLCSLSIPIAYYFISKSTALSILIPITVVFALSDILRLTHEPTRLLYAKLLGWLLRPHERHATEKRLTGATYVLLSATLSIIVFPKLIVITAFSILIISDTVAALVGRKFGRRPFLNKTLEGTLGFFLSAVLVVLVTPKAEGLPLEYAVGIVAACIGAIVEACSAVVDDNLTIPLSIGAAMWILYIWLLPNVNLYILDGAS
jgi:dolichol kinase